MTGFNQIPSAKDQELAYRGHVSAQLIFAAFFRNLDRKIFMIFQMVMVFPNCLTGMGEFQFYRQSNMATYIMVVVSALA